LGERFAKIEALENEVESLRSYISLLHSFATGVTIEK